jgi:DinB superfamily
MIRGEELPFHRTGLPPTDYPDAGAAELGIDLAARPSHDQAVAMHADRRAQVRRVLEAVTDAELDEIRTAVPAPAWGEKSHSVRECLRVVMDEHIEHRRFAERDLSTLEGGKARRPGTG